MEQGLLSKMLDFQQWEEVARFLLNQGFSGACFIVMFILYNKKEEYCKKVVKEALEAERKFRQEAVKQQEKFREQLLELKERWGERYKLGMEKVSQTLDVVITLLRSHNR